MPDVTMTVSALGEPHQLAFANSSTGSATAGSIVVVIPNGMTNADVRRALLNAEEAARRNGSRATGI